MGLVGPALGRAWLTPLCSFPLGCAEMRREGVMRWAVLTGLEGVVSGQPLCGCLPEALTSSASLQGTVASGRASMGLLGLAG